MRFLNTFSVLARITMIWVFLMVIGLIYQMTVYITSITGFSFYVANTLAIMILITIPVIFYNLYKLIKAFLEKN